MDNPIYLGITVDGNSRESGWEEYIRPKTLWRSWMPAPHWYNCIQVLFTKGRGWSGG